MSSTRQAADETTPLLAHVEESGGQELQLSGAASSPKTTSLGRQIGPDLLRGLLMAFMAIDHTSVVLGAYPHGTGVTGENASQVITEWSSDAAYTLRTLSHGCAPGFFFLLGMGVSYFVESVSTHMSASVCSLLTAFLFRRGLSTE
jgi:uncharacterized membrane protein